MKFHDDNQNNTQYVKNCYNAYSFLFKVNQNPAGKKYMYVPTDRPDLSILNPKGQHNNDKFA